MPFSAVDTISPAFEHAKRQLVRPFRFGQWMRLALVGLLAGELSSGGGCNVPSIPNFPNIPRHPGPEHFLPPPFAGIDPALPVGLLLMFVAAGFIFGIVLMYISSVMRFVLFDSVVAGECHIRRSWRHRQGPAWHYFLWKLVYLLATFAVLIVLVGIPAALAYALGWFSEPRQHIVALVLSGLTVFALFAIVMLAMTLIYVLTKDFVVPQMAIENIDAFEGWKRLWAMMKAEKAGYAGYVGMKIVLAIAVGIVVGVISFILALVIFLPAAAIGIAAVLAGKSAGLEWTVYTVLLVVIMGCVLLAVFLFITALISVPAIVFFPAYSIYFFAARYPPLSAVLSPAPPVQVTPQLPPPGQAPPLPPAPEPIG